MRKTRNTFFPVLALLLSLAHLSLSQTTVVKPGGSSGPPPVGGSYVAPPTVAYGSTDLVNYVRTFDFYAPMSAMPVDVPGGATPFTDAINNGTIMQTTNYFDGLGRPIQTVSRMSMPNGAGYSDMVQFMLYDEYGRQVYQPMAYRSGSATGGMRLAPSTELSTFMGGQYTGESIFYGKTEYEASPLNRVTKQMAPGNSWAGNGVGVSNRWRTNNSSDAVRIWTLGGAAASTSDVYGEGELMVTISTDEEGNKVKQFTDKLGRVVLKQVQKGTGTGGGHSDWLNTYYLYDDYGNLAYVLPPLLVESMEGSWSWNSTNVNNLAFQYKYDGRNRMTSKLVPGGGRTQIVYDKLDRPVLTQDSEQQDNGQWFFTKYDVHNRIVMTGLLGTEKSWAELQGELDSWSGPMYVEDEALVSENTKEVLNGSLLSVSHRNTAVDVYRTKSTGAIEFLPGFESETGAEFETERTLALSYEYTAIQGYHDASFPRLVDYEGGYELLTINYYDHYGFTDEQFDGGSAYTGDFYPGGGTLNAVVPAQYTNATGLATGSKVKVLGTEGQWLTTVMFYDGRGRVVQSWSDNHLGGKDVLTTQYDFSGKVLATHTRHANPRAGGSDAQTLIAKHYGYDHAGRLLTVEQKVNGSAFTPLATNSYDALGQLIEKELGNGLETLGYEYNIRGWLKGINKDYATSGTGGNYFGMDLSYDFGFTQNRLNGNIAGVKWRSASDGLQRAYGFDYDASNRLLKADFTQYEGSSWTRANTDFSSAYSYDANGNMLTLQRQGMVLGSIETLDNLTYSYLNSGKSNQLAKVVDTGGKWGVGDFGDGTNGSNDYAYDANGNMNQDLNKDIQGGDIEYNHLNLPSRVTFGGSSTKTIAYTYDAAGIKLAKTVNNQGNVTTTDYVGGFIYENDELQYFAHEEGRVRKDNSGTLVYDYFIKDHLGNTRVTLTTDNEVVIYRATMETDTTTSGVDLKAYEEGIFLNFEDSRDSTGVNHYEIAGIANSDEALKLNGSAPIRRIGPGKMLEVSAGDHFDLEVFARYLEDMTESSAPNGANNLVNALTTAFSNAVGGPTGEGALHDMFNGAKTSMIASQQDGNTASSTVPHAYMTYALFDENFDLVEEATGYRSVDVSARTAWQQLAASVDIPVNGYLYVYVSNETAYNLNVYFDDFTITHTKSKVLQEDHYYPFGMSIAALSSTAPLSKPNKYKFNGIEFNDDFDINIYDAFYRGYDPTIGRWMQVDPKVSERESPYVGMGNNPILYNDYLGDTVKIKYGGFLGIGRKTVKYENGQLFNSDGSAYSGKVKGFLNKTKGALDKINAVSSGQGVLRNLERSQSVFSIRRGSKNTFKADGIGRASLALLNPNMANIAGSGGEIRFNPNAIESGPNQRGNTVRPSFVGLAHELGHANMAEQGLQDFSQYAPNHTDPNLSLVTNDDFNAVNFENQIRSQYNLPLREFYTRDAAGQGFMRFLRPSTSINIKTGVNYLVSFPAIINYLGPNSGR